MSQSDAYMSNQEELIAPHLPQNVDPDTHTSSTTPSRADRKREKKKTSRRERRIEASQEKQQLMLNDNSSVVAGFSRADPKSYLQKRSQSEVPSPIGLRRYHLDDFKEQDDALSAEPPAGFPPFGPLIGGQLPPTGGSVSSGASDSSRPRSKAQDDIETCPHCTRRFSGAYRVGNCARHIRQQHSEPMKDCVCRVCAKPFKRQDARRTHEWKKHNLMDTRPIPRRSEAAIFQKGTSHVLDQQRSEFGYERSKNRSQTPAQSLTIAVETGTTHGEKAENEKERNATQEQEYILEALADESVVDEENLERAARARQLRFEEDDAAESESLFYYPKVAMSARQVMTWENNGYERHRNHIDQARNSVVISRFDNQQWTGYTLPDTGFDQFQDESDHGDTDGNDDEDYVKAEHIARSMRNQPSQLALSPTVFTHALGKRYLLFLSREGLERLSRTASDHEHGEADPERRQRGRSSSINSMERSRESSVHVSQNEEISWNYVASGRVGPHSFDGSSNSSSYARSVFSTASLASSATELSRNSGYSAVQIARATKELIRILQYDKNLVPLYKRAISDVMIGPLRLERNLRRFFKNYAEQLGELAGDRLEHLASRLVRLKAKFVAQSIMEKYDALRPECCKRTTSMQEQEQSSDEEAEAEAVDETEFYDLVSFCDFLVGSEAFEMLHTQMTSFVLPKTDLAGEVEAAENLKPTKGEGEDTGKENGETAREEHKKDIRKELALTSREIETSTKHVDNMPEDIDFSTEGEETTTSDAELTRVFEIIHTENGLQDQTSVDKSQEEWSRVNLAESAIHSKPSTQLRDRSWPYQASVRNARVGYRIANNAMNMEDVTKDSKTVPINLPTAQNLANLKKASGARNRKYGDYFRRISDVWWGNSVLSMANESTLEKIEITMGQSFLESIGLAKGLAAVVLVAFGYLEPPLQSGYTRLRWQCKCGQSFHDDIRELREGGVARLTERMHSSMGIKAIAISYNHSTSNQKYTFAAPSWVRGVGRKVSGMFGRSGKPAQGLPQHTSPTTTSTCTPCGSTPTQQQSLRMIACMRQDRHRHTLYQDPIDQISTDKELFSFMRAQLAQRRGALRNIFSCTCIQGLRLIKFNLWPNGHPDFRKGETSCPSPAAQKCDCIPPKDRVVPSAGAEYQCTPAGPGDTCPPIPSNILMHSLMEPDHIPETQTLVFDQLPKLVCGELKTKANQTIEGWGIHFQDGWDSSKLSSIILGIFLVASLVFAVLWSHFKLDVQGAFGVSAYMVTAAGIFVAWVANRPGNMMRVH